MILLLMLIYLAGTKLISFMMKMGERITGNYL